ncbi:hypothetical protein BDZ89DRAFT_1073131 [Hymenopellis radicata]|nr:hypothetical protein BDZ89DRAFT_1073131 [Hymenopellis radicata]
MSSLGQELGFSEETAQRIIGDSLNVHLIAVFAYGLYTIIFINTIRHIVARGQWPPQRVALTIVVCLIWALTTIDFGFVWNEAYVTFVTHGQTQDSVLRFIFGRGPDAGSWTPKGLAMSLVARLAVILNATLAELTNIWRCWVIWNRRLLVVAFPLLGVICGLRRILSIPLSVCSCSHTSQCCLFPGKSVSVWQNERPCHSDRDRLDHCILFSHGRDRTHLQRCHRSCRRIRLSVLSYLRRLSCNILERYQRSRRPELLS